MRPRIGYVFSLVACMFVARAEAQRPCVRSLAGPQVTDAELAMRWAPIHHQDVDVTGEHSLAGRSDYISAVNYDGDWNATNNWDNVGRYPLRAHAYYSVVETATHWFLLYAFFHPRDWTDSIGDAEHENNLEGVLFVVRQNGTKFGGLEAAITVFHSDFYSYLPRDSCYRAGHETVDGDLRMLKLAGSTVRRPATAQEAKGHGLKAWPYVDIAGDGVRYVPGTIAEQPSDPDDRYVSYGLINIFGANGLWAHWSPTRKARMFTSTGAFSSNESGGCGSGLTNACDENVANAPWGWDDEDDSSNWRGEIATNPAKLVKYYFSNLGQFSTTYRRNPYR